MCLALVMVMGMGTNPLISEAGNLKTQTTYKSSDSDMVSCGYDKEEIPDMDYTKKLKKGCVVVNAEVVCDATYRNKYKKDWKSRSKKTTMNANDILYSKFNIYYKVSKVVAWNSGKTEKAEDLLKMIYDKYNVANDKNIDMVIGYTRKENGSTLGIGYIGLPYALVISTVYKTDIQVAQHETGHNYGLRHCKDKNCTLYPYSYQKNTDKFCDMHASQWKNNRNKY